MKLRLILGTLLATATTVLALTGQGGAGAATSCTAAERMAAMKADQAAVLQRVGSLATLRNQLDVTALALKGWPIPPHGFVSFEDVGVAFSRPDSVLGLAPQPGFPQLLLYAPAAGAADVTEPMDADFPYELVGWAYLAPYDFEQVPTQLGPCYSRDLWFVHERGLHPLDTLRFDQVAPEEHWHGESPGQEPFLPSEPGFPHPRMWDIHLFLNRTTDVPTTGILRPHGDRIAGIDNGVGRDFFFPEPPR